MNLTDPSHLHEFNNGLVGLCSFPQHILHYMSSLEESTTPQSISIASSEKSSPPTQ